MKINYKTIFIVTAVVLLTLSVGWAADGSKDKSMCDTKVDKTAECNDGFFSDKNYHHGRSRKSSKRGSRDYDSHEERKQQRNAEYIKWLGENYPQEANELAQLKQQDEKLYSRRFYVSKKKYGKIAWASQENPEFAEILKEDLVLKEQRAELLKKLETAEGDQQKASLTLELTNLVEKRFDIIVKRKKMSYERLKKRIEKLQKAVEEKQEEMKQWDDSQFKSENINKRVEELLNIKEKINWD